MADHELDFLFSPALREWVRQNRSRDPHRLALQKSELGFPLALAVGQVALLQQVASKLPRMAQAQCAFTQRAVEQSTSESLAELKPWGNGFTALDLTCGLGSDSFALAGHFKDVTSLEPDPSLARIVRFNAELLGIHHLQVVNASAESFLQAYDGPPFDLIYADPDRRDAGGNRVFGLEDCQPNVIELMPLLAKHGRRLLIKGSPMLDLTALQRLFPADTMFWVLSEGNECKEVLIDRGSDLTGVGVIVSRKGIAFRYTAPSNSQNPPIWPADVVPPFLLEADTALYKAGIADRWFQDSGHPGGMLSVGGFFASENPIAGFHGHQFKVMAHWPWKPKEIKTRLKSMGIARVQYSRRDFDLPMEQVRTQISLPEGGHLFLLLTRNWNSERKAYLAERLD